MGRENIRNSQVLQTLPVHHDQSIRDMDYLKKILQGKDLPDPLRIPILSDLKRKSRIRLTQKKKKF